MGDTLEKRIADLRVEADLLELLAQKRDVVTDISYSSGISDDFKIEGKINNFKYSYKIKEEEIVCTVVSNQDTVSITVKKEIPRKILYIHINEKSLHPYPERGGDEEIAESLSTLYECISAGNKIKIPTYTTAEKGETPKPIPERERDNLSTFSWSWEVFEKVETHLHKVIPEFFQIIENYQSGNYSPHIVETPVQLRTKEDVMRAFDLS